jgi:hypothetical protein
VADVLREKYYWLVADKPSKQDVKFLNQHKLRLNPWLGVDADMTTMFICFAYMALYCTRNE